MKKRTFLITGASKGIGFAAAKRLAADGHTPIGLARTKPEADFPGIFYNIDLSNRVKTGELLQKISSEFQLDGVVNNVGIVLPNPLEDITIEELDRAMDLNLRVALQTTQAALPNMKKNKWGRIVNIASLTTAGVPFRTVYAAAKTALVSFTRSWALELAPHNITVNAISPGPTDTFIFNTSNPPGSESRQRYVDNVPLGRISSPDEQGAAIAFFCSDDAAFITGQNLYTDGGSSVGQAPAL